MRYEQRICDFCGRRSELVLVAEPRRSNLTPPQTMAQRGWVIIDDCDSCPDCTWINAKVGA